MSAGLIHPVRPLGAPPLPREHGAWVMLLAPLGAGLVAAGPVSPLPAVALVVAAIAAFLTQNAAALLLRPRAPRTLIPWLGIYVGVLALAGGTLMLGPGRSELLALAAPGVALFALHIWLQRRSAPDRLDRAVWGQVLTAGVLTLGGPAAWAVARGSLGGEAALLWLSFFLAFVSGILHVNMRLDAVKVRGSFDRATRWRLGRNLVVYHVALAAALVAAVFAAAGGAVIAPASNPLHAPHAAVLLALGLLPYVARGLAAFWQLGPGVPSFKRIGLIETAFALWLVGWVVAAAQAPSGPIGLSLELSQLAPLGANQGHYEAWAVVDGTARSLGTFVVLPTGQLVGLDGRPLGILRAPVDAPAIGEVFVTQEPPVDHDPRPSRQRFLSGIWRDGQATLQAPLDPEELALDSAVFTLDNLTTEKNTRDFNGIWFGYVAPDGEFYGGLTLSPLAAELPQRQVAPAWMYAGWTIVAGQALRMGKFAGGWEGDDWNGYSGLSHTSNPINFPAPGMPGQDFIANLPAGVAFAAAGPELAGARVLITLEHAASLNDEPWPSPLHVFDATVPAPATRHRIVTMTNVAKHAIPSGLARAVPLGVAP